MSEAMAGLIWFVLAVLFTAFCISTVKFVIRCALKIVGDDINGR